MYIFTYTDVDNVPRDGMFLNSYLIPHTHSPLHTNIGVHYGPVLNFALLGVAPKLIRIEAAI